MGNKPSNREDLIVGELCQLSDTPNSYKFKLEDCNWTQVHLRTQPGLLEIYERNHLLRELPTQKNLELYIEKIEKRVTLMFIGKKLAREKWVLRLNSYDFMLFISNLKRAKRPTRKQAVQCQTCETSFSVFRGKRHCRQCGRCICNKCGRYFTRIPDLGYYNRVRICVECKRLRLMKDKSSRFQNQHSCSKSNFF